MHAPILGHGYSARRGLTTTRGELLPLGDEYMEKRTDTSKMELNWMDGRNFGWICLSITPKAIPVEKSMQLNDQFSPFRAL